MPTATQMAPHAPAPPQGAGTGAREKLLDAAASLIIERHTIEISLAEIAGRASLNSALVKYYFGSKLGLLAALLQRDATRATAEMTELLKLDAPADQKMRLHLRGIMTTYRRSPYLNRLLHAMLRSQDEALCQQVRRTLIQPVFECQAAILDQGAAAGQFRRVDHRLFYLSATGACDQFMQTENVLLLEQDGIDLDKFRDAYINHVVEMVMASLSPTPAANPPATPSLAPTAHTTSPIAPPRHTKPQIASAAHTSPF
jgi:AcrR family transcriptional regulator